MSETENVENIAAAETMPTLEESKPTTEEKPIEFLIGPVGPYGRRLVIAQYDGEEVLRDRLDTDSLAARITFIKAVRERLAEKKKSEELEPAAELEKRLLAASDATDKLTPSPNTVAPTEKQTEAAFCIRKVDPYPHPVNLSDVLTEAVTTGFLKYVYMHPFTACALALWAAGTYVFDLFDIYPYLFITSPLKRCGKTTTLKILNTLVNKPCPVSNVTSAAIFRIIEAHKPTLLIDEADANKMNEEMRGILNSGHEKDLAWVARCVPDTANEIAFSSTWSPKAIAGIGSLPTTIEDRSIIVKLERKPDSLDLPKFRRQAKKEMLVIASKFARFALDHADKLPAEADPDLPDELNDRARDNWRPLAILADYAGGPWPEQVRQCAETMGREDIEKQEIGVKLLASIADIMSTGGLASPLILSSDLLNELHKREEWGRFGSRDRPITPHYVAKILRDFGLRPKHYRQDGHTLRAYSRSDLVKAINTYTPHNEKGPQILE